MSDSTFVQSVRDSLEESRSAIAELVSKRDGLQNDVKQGKYSAQYAAETVQPKIDGLTRDVERLKAEAEQKTNSIVDQYVKQLAAEDCLDPAALTEDVRLFNCGVTLSEADVNAIMSRNAENKTMLRLASQYAAEHGIKTAYRYQSNAQRIRSAESVRELASRYVSNWISDPKQSAYLLQRYFEAL